MQETIKSCADCRAWVRLNLLDDGEKRKGLCVRQSPRRMWKTKIISKQLEVETSWPPTDEINRCMDFIPKSLSEKAEAGNISKEVIQKTKESDFELIKKTQEAQSI